MTGTRKWYLANREEILAYWKRYRNENKEKAKKRKQDYHLRNRESLNAKAKQYREDNLDARKAYGKAYYQRTRDKSREREAKRRVEKKEEIRKTRLIWLEQNKEKAYAARRDWYAKNKVVVALKSTTKRIANWLERAGWSWDEYDIRYSLGCEICGGSGGPTYKSGIVFDHCHKTGKVRGLLCARCNRFLDWALKFQSEITRYEEANCE